MILEGRWGESEVMLSAVLTLLLNLQEAPVASGSSSKEDLTAGMQAPASNQDNIVIIGQPSTEDPTAPVTMKTMTSGRNFLAPRVSRSMFSFSQRWARCVFKTPNRKLLRKALDDRIGSSAQMAAQERLVRTHSSCTENPTAVRNSGWMSGRVATATSSPVADMGSGPEAKDVFSSGSDFSGGAIPLYDPTFYDRGALYVAAIRAFAPDLRLSRDDLSDPAVLERFNTRETSLARFRLQRDKKYFLTAICLVKAQPELAIQLVNTDEPPSEVAQLAANLVNRTRPCAAGAGQVYFDPTQFRFYIAEALYRWAVAAKGVDSLIPA